MSSKTGSRKLDHLNLCSDGDAEHGSSGFEDIILVHNALPEINYDDIDLSVNFLNKELSSPLFISAMTGGHPKTKEINRVLALGAEEYNLALGVGSQRAAIEDPSLEDTFRIVRDTAPNAFICANLGSVQLVRHGMDWAEKAVEMIDADAICIHLNFLQEAVQPEGEPYGAGAAKALKELCRELKKPVIVKETGCGISKETAWTLCRIGVSAIDTGGFGGTSWVKVEGKRAAGDKTLAELGNVFLNWGIPTAVSVFEAAKVKRCPLISTGGLKTGLDIAKSIAIGADLGGMALSLLVPAMKGKDELFNKINRINAELRTAMFLSGSKDIASLSKARYYVKGDVREMLQAL